MVESILRDHVSAFLFPEHHLLLDFIFTMLRPQYVYLKNHFPQVRLSDAGWCPGLITGDDQADPLPDDLCWVADVVPLSPPLPELSF